MLGTGLAAALPIIVAAVYAVVDGWVPLGDDAFITTRSFDVFTDRSPQVGQYSSGATAVLDEPAYTPGPLLFWLLAVPVRLPWPSAPAVLMGAVNVACVLGLVALARRRGGPALMVAVAIAVPVMLMSLPSETYSDVWNPSAPLLPLALLVFLAWSLACGEWRLLPVVALVASYVAQAHLPVVVPALAVVAVGLAGALFLRRPAGDPDVPRSRLKWVAAAVVVLLACWVVPVIEELTNDPGNLTLLERSATTDEPTLGSAAGWRAVVHTVGVPPWWLRDATDPLERIDDLRTTPGAVAVVSTVLVLGALAGTALIGWRRRRPAVCAAGALGLALCAGAAIDASSTPESTLATVNYVFRWTSPAGMCVWVLLGWSIAGLVAGRRRSAPAPGSAPAPAWRARSAAVAGLGATVLVGAAVAISQNPPRDEPYGAMRAINQRLVDDVPKALMTRVDAAFGSEATFPLAVELQVGAVHRLRREGFRIIAPDHVGGLGSAYGRGAPVQVIRIGADEPKELGGRVLARLEVADPVRHEAAPLRIVTATLGPPAPP